MPRSPEKNFRRVALLAPTSDGDDLIDIPKINHINAIMVVLTATVTLATATATSQRAHSPCGLIKRISFIQNGKNTISNVPFAHTCFGNYQRKFDVEVTPLSALTVAAYNVRAVGVLDMDNVDGLRPKDSAFKARNNDLLQMRFDYGDSDDILTLGSSVSTISNWNVEVLIDSTAERDDQVDEAKAIKVRSLQTIQTGASANSNLRVKLPRGNHIRLVSVLAKDASDPSNALINTLQFVKDGVDVRVSSGYDALRSKNRHKTQQAIPDGFAVLDSSPEGKMSEFFNVVNAGEVELVIDHNAPVGTGEIEIVTEEYILPG